MSQQIGVVLSGCGVYDGSEIHETVATLAAIDQHGYQAHCFAPDIPQMHVVNHLTGDIMQDEKRNVLVEAARIARGKIQALSEVQVDALDALVLPGGFGAAKNLSTYAVAQQDMQVDTQLAEIIRQFHQQGKPIVALCISPVIIAKVLGSNTPKLTLGEAGDTSEHAQSLGADHSVSSHESVVVDEKNRLITSPCYMLDANIGQIMRSADKAITALKAWLPVR